MSNPIDHPGGPHYVTRSGWLRAAVLGGNDGIISVAALIVGVAAADASPTAVMIAGIAGLSAGATSMAAGEYVSVSSQSDIERADIVREADALEKFPDAEFDELVDIYQKRGLTEETARCVAQELTHADALGAHLRDELGMVEGLEANPLQAAFLSALAFSLAGAIPLLAAGAAPADRVVSAVLISTVLSLAVLGSIGAKLGGAPIIRAVLRVVILGLFALAVTFGVGWLFNVTV